MHLRPLSQQGWQKGKAQGICLFSMVFDNRPLPTFNNVQTQDEVSKMIPPVMQSHQGKWLNEGRWLFNTIFFVMVAIRQENARGMWIGHKHTVSHSELLKCWRGKSIYMTSCKCVAFHTLGSHVSEQIHPGRLVATSEIQSFSLSSGLQKESSRGLRLCGVQKLPAVIV